MGEWYYFPIVAGGKEPALPGDWQKHSTNDPAIIEGWEREGYNLAVDCGKSGIFVVDLDVDKRTKEFLGQRSWGTLIEQHGVIDPETLEIASPRKGIHKYFDDPAGRGRTSTGTLAAGIDTRGRGGYVLIEGSRTTDGAYGLAKDAPLARVPNWLLRAQEEQARPDQVQTASSVSQLDLEVNVKRALRYLDSLAPVQQGGGADIGTLKAAMELRDLGLSAEKTTELLRSDRYKITPRDARFDDFVTRKVDNAYRYAQNTEAGAWGVDPLTDTYSGVLDTLPPDDPEGVDKPPRWQALFREQQDKLQPPTWLIPGIVARQGIAAVYAQPHRFKSFLVQAQGFSLASTDGDWGLEEGHKPEQVIYITEEGLHGIGAKRRPAWETVRGVEASNFILLRGEMLRANDDGMLVAFADWIKTEGLRPSLLIIDTWISFLGGLKENDATESQIGVNKLRWLRDKLLTAIMVVAHSGKDDSAGPRGTNALAGGVDALHRVDRPSMSSTAVAWVNLHHKDADISPPIYRLGQDVGDTLVFGPSTEAEFKDLTTVGPDITGPMVAAVLHARGAVDPEHAITTHVLAMSLRSQPIDELPEATEAAVATLVRKLQAGARSYLAGYAIKDGNSWLWAFMPTA